MKLVPLDTLMRAASQVLSRVDQRQGQHALFGPHSRVWYQPTVDDLLADQPRPETVRPTDTEHVKTFDLVEDQYGEIDELLTSVGLQVRSGPYRRSPPTKVYTVDQLPQLAEYPGYVAFTKGEGTFLAKEKLKKLGGFWRPTFQWDRWTQGAWLIPEDRAEAALQLVQQAEQSRVPLPADDPHDPKLRCYVCGQQYSLNAFIHRAGADAHSWYCGCAETNGRTQSKS